MFNILISIFVQILTSYNNIYNKQVNIMAKILKISISGFAPKSILRQLNRWPDFSEVLYQWELLGTHHS